MGPNSNEFQPGLASGLIIAGLGAVSFGAITIDDAEAGQQEVLTAPAVEEAKKAFDKLVNNPKMIASLGKLNKEQVGAGMKFALVPQDVFKDYMSSSPNMTQCKVIAMQMGIEVTSSGNAKIVFRLVTKMGANGQPEVYRQLSRPATKR